MGLGHCTLLARVWLQKLEQLLLEGPSATERPERGDVLKVLVCLHSKCRYSALPSPSRAVIHSHSW